MRALRMIGAALLVVMSVLTIASVTPESAFASVSNYQRTDDFNCGGGSIHYVATFARDSVTGNRKGLNGSVTMTGTLPGVWIQALSSWGGHWSTDAGTNYSPTWSLFDTDHGSDWGTGQSVKMSINVKFSDGSYCTDTIASYP